ncbi:MAG: RrF2 family transcriptional regulator [Anaerovoracaceae bacterium]
MLINRDTDYAVRIIRSLQRGNLLPVTHISSEQNIPIYYAYKIIKKLENHKILIITRGGTGGCQLTKKTSRISLYDVITAMDHSRNMNECTIEGRPCTWKDKNSGHCSVHEAVKGLEVEMVKKLKSIKLSDILKK